MESPRNEDALTAPEVASILQINRNTVYALAKEGALNSYRVGRKLRFTMKDVQSYIDSAKHNAPAPAAAPVEAAAPGANSTEGARFAIGGHDMMLDITANYLAAMNLPVQRSYTSSYQALVDLYQGRSQAAGIHLWDGETNTYNLPYVRRLLPGIPCVVFRLASRSQGLLVRQGNPLGLRRWSDLLLPEVVLANREKGAGARVLLDEHLRMLEAPYQAIQGYDRELSSELAVGTFVAQGLADVGIGSEKTFQHVPGLDYLPLVTETLDLVVLKTPQTKKTIRSVRSLLTTRGFQAEFKGTIGLDISKMGAIIYEC